MSAVHARARRTEHRGARLLGTVRRVRASLYESASDLETATLPNGCKVVGEVKNRAAFPAIVTAALEQAEGYAAPGELAVGIIAKKGAKDLIVVMRGDVFRRIAGLNDTENQGDKPCTTK